jgi:hypothetical protein
MRYLFVVSLLMLSPLTTAVAQISFQFNMPSVSIGFSQPHYPELVAVPGYPVYYDPTASSNYFFYDGLYWVYEGDSWYASDWYDGPWALVQPHAVPVFILRIPVGYYRHPPTYFQGWQRDSAPRWGEHYGRDWERQRGGWDRWDRQSAPPPAPLPAYQRQYSGTSYPRGEQQRAIRTQNYRHEPRDAAVKEVYRAKSQDRGTPQAPRSEPTRQAPASPSRASPATQGTPQQPLHAVEQPRQAPPKQQQRAEPARQAPPQQQHAEPARQAPPQQQHAEPVRQAPPQQQQRAEPARQAPPQQQHAEPARQAPPQQQQRAEPARQAPPQQQQQKRAEPQARDRQGQRDEPKDRQDQGQQKRD